LVPCGLHRLRKFVASTGGPLRVTLQPAQYVTAAEHANEKELQVAQLQDRLIQLPSAEEPEPTEQGSERGEPLTAQSEESRNAISRFWHWFVGQ
jgi:hypothetical protein